VKDDWLANKMLRDQFRAKKKEIKARLEADKTILNKCGLELELVEEREEDVRMARLLNVQAKTEADERRTEERGDISNGNIFQKKISTVDKDGGGGGGGDKKLFALKTLGKATKSKQSQLLKSKGFGLVLSKAKGRNPQLPTNIAQVTSASKSKKDDENLGTLKASPPEGKQEPCNNSLSMLFSQYDNSSDEET